MVHQGKQHAIRARGHGEQVALHGTGLPALIVRVEYERGRPQGMLADAVAVRPENHDHRLAERGEQADQGIEKALLAVAEQRFGEAHAARLPGGENDSGDAHCESTVRSPSPAKTDRESERQLDWALRRTAIISAVTEIAISSGEMAPISSPMGAWMRSNAARAMPCFSSSRITF